MNAFFEIRFAELVHLAVRKRASDIHLVPHVKASIRVDGLLEYVDGPALSPAETESLARELLSETSAAKLDGDGDVTVTRLHQDQVVMRVHAFKTNSAVALAIRLLPHAVPSLESLDLPPVVAGFAKKRKGLLLFAGPTGSGKSTTMAALLGRINAELSYRILTIEDPIEYRHKSERSVVAQREVGRDVPSFAHAVIGALRADPDVIMIGEMRDAPTMRAAIAAAETGHLVLSTVHTGDAVQTIDRIVDAFDGSEQAQLRAQFSASLAAIVCQRLVPRADGAGRRLAAEVLVATDAVRATIREARTHQLQNLMMTGRHAGMQTMEHHLSELLCEGRIDRSAAASVLGREIEVRNRLEALV